MVEILAVVLIPPAKANVRYVFWLSEQDHDMVPFPFNEDGCSFDVDTGL